MKILVVEDELPAAAFLKRGLSEEGFAVDVAHDGNSADDAVAINMYDLILLDVMLPGQDGFALCKQWRAEGVTTPILFLTARDEVTDRIQGLNLGSSRSRLRSCWRGCVPCCGAAISRTRRNRCASGRSA
jgi:DNA-binding response OmpR family regulator